MEHAVICEAGSVAPVRALVVDDAPLMRKVIRQVLSKRADIEVVGTATNGRECLQQIPELQPDVITLDIDMPVMNGITTVKNIMVRHQIPIVIVSSLIEDGYFAFEALRLGVMDFIPKPARVFGGSWEDEEELVRKRVRMASEMRIHRMHRVRRKKKGREPGAAADAAPEKVILMGTTLAGPNTIMHIVSRLPADFPGTIIAVQELHPRILAPFCSCLSEISPLEVIPVVDREPLRPGRMYLSSTFNRLAIEPSPSSSSGEVFLSRVESEESPIDVLFKSGARCFGPSACGVLLTGTGTDGVEGIKEIKSLGGLTIGQEQESCVYPNLVECAAQHNVLDALLPTEAIASHLASWARSE